MFISVFVLVSHQHTITSLLYILYILCAVKFNNNNNNKTQQDRRILFLVQCAPVSIYSTIDLVTNYGFDPQERDSNGSTCLHYSAAGNHVNVVGYLIKECSCDPMSTDKNGCTIVFTKQHWRDHCMF